MNRRWMPMVGAALLLPTNLVPPGNAQPEVTGPYARIAIMHPLDGHSVDFEAAYIRHLAWHRQAKDSWSWYGWTVNYSERRLWFVYASFGHSAASFDDPVDPVGDDRDNVMNVAPHVDQWRNALYEFLPALSRGTGVPRAVARLELTTVDLKPGTSSGFESSLRAVQSGLKDETLWYRLVAGGTTPRYIRLRPRGSLAAILDGRAEEDLPPAAVGMIAQTTIEILNLRPAMCYGVTPVSN